MKELDTAETSELEAQSRGKLFAKIAGWTSLSIGALLFFSLIKMPDTKIRAWVDHQIRASLEPYGYSLESKDSALSFFLSPKYRMKDVTLTQSLTSTALVFKELEFRPKVLTLVTGRLGGIFTLSTTTGALILDVSTDREFKEMKVDFDIDNFNFEKTDLLQFFTKLKSKGTLDGNVSFHGDSTHPERSDGKFQLSIEKLVLPAQNFFGFDLPQISVGEGKIDGIIENGKISFKAARLGKSIDKDDLTAELTGTILLNAILSQSALDLNLDFALSQKVLNSLSFVASLLSPAKKPDGHYGYQIKGNLLYPDFQPGGSPK